MITTKLEWAILYMCMVSYITRRYKRAPGSLYPAFTVNSFMSTVINVCGFNILQNHVHDVCGD